MTLLIDPPSGWKYGFPKPYNNPGAVPLEEWLLANGYPQHEIDNHGAKYCRFIGDHDELVELADKTDDQGDSLLPAFRSSKDD